MKTWQHPTEPVIVAYTPHKDGVRYAVWDGANLADGGHWGPIREGTTHDAIVWNILNVAARNVLPWGKPDAVNERMQAIADEYEAMPESVRLGRPEPVRSDSGEMSFPGSTMAKFKGNRLLDAYGGVTIP